MFFASARRVALGVAVLGLAACSSSSAGSDAFAPGGVDANSASLSFEGPNELTLSPLVTQTVSVHLTGADAQVQLWLAGEYGDASLSEGDVTTSGGGASFTLRAPSVATTFSIFARASGAADARLDVAVSASGFATISVATSYDGKRPTPSVVASVFVTSKCADLDGELADGTLGDGAPSVSGSLTTPIRLESVPAGSHLAISVRVANAEYAAGCVDLDALPAMSMNNVTVVMLDRPMALGQTDLAARFSVEIDSTVQASATAMLTAAIGRAEGAFRAQGTSDAAALLDAMTALVPAASNAQFVASRSSQGWDATTTAWLATHTPSIDTLVDGWLHAGATSAIGDVTAQVTAGQTSGYASVTVSTFATLDATKAGVTVTAPFSWTADANDVVHLAGSLSVAPSALVCAAATASAIADVSGATDVASALASSIDCAGLATAMVGSTGSAYTGCDADCTASLCGSALRAMWQSAHDASSDAMDYVSLSMTTSAPATVDEDAAPASFTGAWVGQAQSVQDSFAPFALHGSAAAQAGVTPPH